ncbi:cytochrome B [Halorientalis sp. IM1011]|uniref:Rieske 2Fe-2S domain-containing protein n=1 Tax=Halorientalis sp. IM1011 TaxID=1932360 RepID=UPI00097CC44C|nr:Rieske 2Fe-2S domain-containing protein [Halorientalis sp. IM1011]AQL43820.1 cytochrome B [Halorientalis sp. IM1011]
MPLDEDKYPSETGRRRFVKGVVGSAALSSVGVGGAVALDTATSPTGTGGGITQFMGIENTDGPAPRGMPIIPLTVDSEGALKGVWPDVKTETVQGQEVTIAETELGGTTYSSAWFQYCGIQTAEGLDPEADQDNFFRSSSGPSLSWQSEAKESGEKLFVDDFSDYESWGNGIGQSGLGKPAEAAWRSDGDVQTVPVQVLRSPEVSKMANGEGPYSELPGEVQSFIGAATEQNFMAWLNKCTHFCCVPGFKTYEGSAKFDAENEVYCQCHQSVYDPFSPVSKSFVALPRPGE